MHTSHTEIPKPLLNSAHTTHSLLLRVLLTIALLISAPYMATYAHAEYTNTSDLYQLKRHTRQPSIRHHANTAKKITAQTLRYTYNLLKFYGIMDGYLSAKVMTEKYLKLNNLPLNPSISVSFLGLLYAGSTDITNNYFQSFRKKQETETYCNLLKNVIYGMGHLACLVPKVSDFACISNMRKCNNPECFSLAAIDATQYDKAILSRRLLSDIIMIHSHAASAFKHFRCAAEQCKSKIRGIKIS